MSSRLASASKSPPKRVTMPPLPLPIPTALSRASTPPSPSPARGMGSLETEMGFLSVGTTNTRPSSSATSPLAGAGVTPLREDDVFAYAPPTGPAALRGLPGHISQRVDASFRGPATAFGSFEPRADRLIQGPNARNAQGIFPPEALIFVANLSSQKTVEQLQQSCHEVFDEFGTCHIFVKYDPRRHPFAFVQFENVEDANQAMTYTTDLELDGRKIRLERGKADRAVIMSKKDGSALTEAEARGVLEPYGKVELCVPAESNHLNIRGMYVKFAFYLDCRDALKNHNNMKSPYTIVLAPAMEPRFNLGPDGLLMVRGFASPRSIMDARSIFVGNLPEFATRPEVEALFQEFGSIIQTNIIKKAFTDGGINVFAFVEFAHPNEADRASLAERELHGNKLRIEPKEYSSRRASRFNIEKPIVHHHAPRYNHNHNNNHTGPMMMNRGGGGGGPRAYDYNYHHPSSSAAAAVVRQFPVYTNNTSTPYHNPPGAPTLYHAQPIFNPMMTQVETPPHHSYGMNNNGQGYGHGHGHGHQSNIAALPGSAAAYQTPPSSSNNYAQHALPLGLFTPTPQGNNNDYCGSYASSHPWVVPNNGAAPGHHYNTNTDNEGTYWR
ncbi:hypothetical protein LTS17_001216 [Exophiala oligosperma]